MTEADAAIEVIEDGWRDLEIAAQLWALVDQPRGARIDALLDRLGGEDRVLFLRQDIEQLDRLLPGLVEALSRAGTIDADWRIPEASVDEIARLAPALDTRSERAFADRVHMVGEGIVRVKRVGAFLRRALEAGQVVTGE